jgi:hypothetical protein
MVENSLNLTLYYLINRYYIFKYLSSYLHSHFYYSFTLSFDFNFRARSK